MEGNTAWIGQKVTHTTLPEIAPEGSEWTMQIQVDDQGILASIALRNDWLSDQGLGEDCNDKGDLLAVYSQYWDEGRVQIR